MIPFVDLKSQFKAIEKDVRARLDAIFEHGQFILGPEVRELERRLAAFAGTRHCVSCASGTDALYMALLAHGVGPGDAVFTTPFTFFASAEVIGLLGATPVFVDVDSVSFNMDPKALARAEEALRRNDPKLHPLPAGADKLTARGIIAVDIFGMPCDYDEIHEVARAAKLWVIEDAAQSFGAEYKGRRAGALAEIACTSFFPAKPLGCYGDGGAILTDRDDLAEKLVSIRVHGQGADRYEHVRLGITGRLDSMQAAVLLAKLAIFEREIEARQRLARRYTELISRAAKGIVAPAVPADRKSAWAQYSVLCEGPARREELRARLQDAGVPTAIYYPIPLHQQKVFQGLGYARGTLPVSEELGGRIFALPMHPYLDEATAASIVAALEDTVRSAA